MKTINDIKNYKTNKEKDLDPSEHIRGFMFEVRRAAIEEYKNNMSVHDAYMDAVNKWIKDFFGIKDEEIK